MALALVTLWFIHDSEFFMYSDETMKLVMKKFSSFFSSSPDDVEFIVFWINLCITEQHLCFVTYPRRRDAAYSPATVWHFRVLFIRRAPSVQSPLVCCFLRPARGWLTLMIEPSNYRHTVVQTELPLPGVSACQTRRPGRQPSVYLVEARRY